MPPNAFMACSGIALALAPLYDAEVLVTTLILYTYYITDSAFKSSF